MKQIRYNVGQVHQWQQAWGRKWQRKWKSRQNWSWEGWETDLRTWRREWEVQKAVQRRE